ncbi:MAG: hypothetical protein J6T37_06540 [Bacteroidales bacterium]|nr:hypothetical protein [Bacteroidales bacterium]
MKKVSLLLVVAFFAALFTVTSCTKDDDKDNSANYSELIVGRWKTNAEQPYYEVYYSNGTGKMWDTAEDVQEEDADTFDWTIDSNNKLTQIIHFQEGQADLPQYCNIITLNETTFKYNNDGWRRTVNLIRVN